VKVSVLVPFADQGCEYRTRAWAYVRNHYATNHAGWHLVVGNCAGPWSKGAAISDALTRTDGDVLVLADADSWCDPDALRLAVATDAPWVVPHGKVYRLNQRGTAKLYSGLLQRGHTARRPYIGPAGGGLVVLSRTAYETVGGFDPRFSGWGGEDISLGWALDTLVGPYTRIGTQLHHLWHPHPAPSHRGSPETEALAARYKAARGDRTAMATLVAEHSTLRREVTAG
jgi:hypothetical protein